MTKTKFAIEDWCRLHGITEKGKPLANKALPYMMKALEIMKNDEVLAQRVFNEAVQRMRFLLPSDHILAATLEYQKAYLKVNPNPDLSIFDDL